MLQILLVEDNPDDQLLARRVAKKQGATPYQLHILEDGELALEWLHTATQQRNLPDLIVLDLKLPKVGGLEVLQNIRQAVATKHIPVIILTTSDEISDINTCYERGANSYIKKPVCFEKFSEIWQQIDQYWLHTNQPAAIN